jgi:hypothetical protein
VEETRRTAEGNGNEGIAEPASLADPADPADHPAPAPRRRLRRLVLVLAALFLLAVGVVQLWAWDQAKLIRRDLAVPHPDLQSIAQRYSSVARWSFLSPDLYGLGGDLLGSLSGAAGRILDSYHGDDPTTTQRGWQTAYDDLRAAAQIAPRDRKVRARMLYARAHLDRIESITLRNQGDRKKALAATKEAAAEFREAARWDPKWPDPYLGLARIAAYDLFDLEALQVALGDLGRLGYPIGHRETAMLADGFRMQGLGLEARAQKARGTPGEAALLTQARADLQQAVRYYDEIPGYADSAANRAEVEQHLQAIEARLAPPAQPPPNLFERLGRALLRELGKPEGR